MDVIKLDDYNLVVPYLEKLNKDTVYLQTRQESNLLILGNFLSIKQKMILHKHLTVYGIASILSIRICIISSIFSLMKRKLFLYSVKI